MLKRIFTFLFILTLSTGLCARAVALEEKSDLCVYEIGKTIYGTNPDGIVTTDIKHDENNRNPMLLGSKVYAPLYLEDGSPVTEKASVEDIVLETQFILYQKCVGDVRIAYKETTVFEGITHAYFIEIALVPVATFHTYDIAFEVRLTKESGTDGEGRDLFFKVKDIIFMEAHNPRMDHMVGHAPSGSSVGISTSAITMTFDKKMNSLKGTITINGSTVDISKAKWTNGTKTISIPLVGLSYGTRYTVVASGFEDAYDITPLGQASWSFTTADKGDGTIRGGTSRGGKGAATAAKTQPALHTAQPLDEATLSTVFDTALTASAAKGNLALYFKNIGEITPQLAKQLNDKTVATGLPATYFFDMPMSAGVGIRLYMKPENITGGFTAAGALENSQITAVENHFRRWFKNEFRAFYTGSGSYNGNVQAAVYLDLTDWDTGNIRLYYYNLETNSFIPIEVQNVSYANKYLYLTVDHGDYIVVSQGPLERK